MRCSGVVSCAVGAGDTSSGDATSRSLLNSASKQSRHTPFALTGVVHLLYFLPHVLQIDMNNPKPNENYVFGFNYSNKVVTGASELVPGHSVQTPVSFEPEQRPCAS